LSESTEELLARHLATALLFPGQARYDSNLVFADKVLAALVPALSSVALAAPLVPAMVATEGLEEAHVTGPSITSPLISAVN
jgi:hypothetical protein